MSELRMEFVNDTPQSLVLLLEPWGEDYTIMPRQSFEFVATGVNSESKFHIEYRPNCIALWVRGAVERVEVFCHGGEIHGGHQRQPGSEFG